MLRLVPELRFEGHGIRPAESRRAVRARPSHPNALAPRKRPFHTIIPAFMEHGDQHIGFGIMGGANQPLAHAQFVSNFVDYGMNIQAALSEPRFTVRPTDVGIGCDLLIESRVGPSALNCFGKKDTS